MKGEEKMKRRLKILATVIICVMAVSLVLASSPSIAAWIDNSVVNIISAPATATFTTTVVGVATNAGPLNTIDINGNQYNSANIGTYSSGAIQGDPNTASIASITASGFLPNDYVQFQVTITNTGSATLAFSTTYTILDQFVNSAGTPIGYIFPSNDPYNANYNDPVKTVAVSHPWTVADWGTDNLATFQTYLTNNALVGCASTWCQDNALPAGTTTMPTTLAPNTSFTYYIYTGLGAQTVYGIPACHYQIAITLTPAA
jgi:hypothetical protein